MGGTENTLARNERRGEFSPVFQQSVEPSKCRQTRSQPSAYCLPDVSYRGNWKSLAVDQQVKLVGRQILSEELRCNTR